VDRKNLGATLRVGGIHLNLSVETTGTKKSGVEAIMAMAGTLK
jgi:hypothetical protein